MVPESTSLPSFIAQSMHEYFLCVKLMPAKHTISFTLPDSKQLVGLPIKETLQILYTSVENKCTNQAKKRL